MSGMAQAFGLAGLILAPPISIVCQVLWSRLVGRRQVSGAASQISDLKDRQGLVGEAIQVMAEPPLPIVTSSMERLARLIEKSEPILEGGSANPGPPDKPDGSSS